MCLACEKPVSHLFCWSLNICNMNICSFVNFHIMIDINISKNLYIVRFCVVFCNQYSVVASSHLCIHIYTYKWQKLIKNNNNFYVLSKDIESRLCVWTMMQREEKYRSSNLDMFVPHLMGKCQDQDILATENHSARNKCLKLQLCWFLYTLGELFLVIE